MKFLGFKYKLTIDKKSKFDETEEICSHMLTQIIRLRSLMILQNFATARNILTDFILHLHFYYVCEPPQNLESNGRSHFH